jgi:hypothetical protein
MQIGGDGTVGNHCQQEAFEAQGSPRTRRQWLVEMIKRVLKIAWDTWQYRNEVLHGERQELACKGDGFWTLAYFDM